MSFGFEVGDIGEVSLCGEAPVLDGAWHHVAATRDADNDVSLWIDGTLASRLGGPDGDGSMAEALVGVDPGDRYLVLGGDKRDTGRPGFAGLFDDLRLSDTDIYRNEFERPAEPLAVEPETIALYDFDQGDGTGIVNRAAPGNGHGEVRFGGSPFGPIWSDDVPIPE